MRSGNMKEKRVYCLIVVLSLLTILCGCSKHSKKDLYVPIDTGTNEEIEEKYDTQVLGVVKEVNTKAQSVTLYDIENSVDIILEYQMGADIKNKYQQPISISQLNLGEIVDVSYLKETENLVKLQISNEAWEYKGVKKLEVNKTDLVMKISKQKYRYTEGLVIASVDGLLDLIDINNIDELTVKGVGGKIYSIIVTKGHGYIRLSNYTDFIGGTLEVGYGIMEPVMENMLIVAPEGIYKLYMENGELTATKSVSVVRNQETTVDMGEYRIERERVGLVNFLVEPEGADIYINGNLVDYGEPFELNYGEHTIVVSLSGYSDYYGILSVAEAYQNIYINLAEASTEVDTEEDVTTIEVVEPDSEEAKETVTGRTEVDSEHVISVQSPEGAEVYLNGAYKGIVPCSFTKEIGIHTVTLSQDGYTTKSYTVEVLDDTKDVSLNFSSLVALKR